MCKYNHFMKTTISNKTKNGAIYDQYDNTSDYYVDGVCVASLNHNGDRFETHEDMTEDDKDFYYKEMVIDKAEFETFKSYQ